MRDTIVELALYLLLAAVGWVVRRLRRLDKGLERLPDSLDAIHHRMESIAPPIAVDRSERETQPMRAARKEWRVNTPPPFPVVKIPPDAPRKRAHADTTVEDDPEPR